MTFEEVIQLKGKNAPREVIEQLMLVEVPFLDFRGKHQSGQLVVHKELVEEVKVIFQTIKEASFPIESIIPARREPSKGPTNNTSAFNYRPINQSNKLSQHSFGRAIDINPALNPFFSKHGIKPDGATYDLTVPGTITADSEIVRIFESFGWEWLGHQKKYSDYMHFEKTAA